MRKLTHLLLAAVVASLLIQTLAGCARWRHSEPEATARSEISRVARAEPSPTPAAHGEAPFFWSQDAPRSTRFVGRKDPFSRRAAVEGAARVTKRETASAPVASALPASAQGPSDVALGPPGGESGVSGFRTLLRALLAVAVAVGLGALVLVLSREAVVKS